MVHVATITSSGAIAMNNNSMLQAQTNPITINSNSNPMTNPMQMMMMMSQMFAQQMKGSPRKRSADEEPIRIIGNPAAYRVKTAVEDGAAPATLTEPKTPPAATPAEASQAVLDALKDRDAQKAIAAKEAAKAQAEAKAKAKSAKMAAAAKAKAKATAKGKAK